MPLACRSTLVPRGFALAFALTVLIGSAAPARAETLIGVDIDYVLPVDSEVEFGGGFAVRLGQQLHLPMIAITPELAITYASFSEAYGPSIYRGVVGLRLGAGEIIRPGAFAHIGVGRFELDVPGRSDPTGSELTYDVGLVLDFTLLPILNFGVHGAYNRLAGDSRREPFEWLTLGAHAEVVF
jgi:hypothetical protein